MTEAENPVSHSPIVRLKRRRAQVVITALDQDASTGVLVIARCKEVSMITEVNILDFIEQCMRDGMTESEAELMADVAFNLHEPEEIEHEEEAW